MIQPQLWADGVLERIKPLETSLSTRPRWVHKRQSTQAQPASGLPSIADVATGSILVV